MPPKIQRVTKGFPEKVNSDTSLQEKLKAAAAPEAAIEIAKEAEAFPLPQKILNHVIVNPVCQMRSWKVQLAVAISLTKTCDWWIASKPTPQKPLHRQAFYCFSSISSHQSVFNTYNSSLLLPLSALSGLFH